MLPFSSVRQCAECKAFFPRLALEASFLCVFARVVVGNGASNRRTHEKIML
jgi:hypothetical protein